MEFVNGKDDIPYMKWKIKNVWNHQPDIHYPIIYHVMYHLNHVNAILISWDMFQPIWTISKSQLGWKSNVTNQIEEFENTSSSWSNLWITRLIIFFKLWSDRHHSTSTSSPAHLLPHNQWIGFPEGGKKKREPFFWHALLFLIINPHFISFIYFTFIYLG